MNIPKTSPWGKVQSHSILANGVIHVSCAGHGGIKVDRKQNTIIPEVVRRADGWYEEDCAYSIPFVILKIGDEERQNKALKTLASWYPDFYEQYTGQILKPGESYKKDKKQFEEDNRNNLIAVSAGGTFYRWQKKTPAEYVPVFATLGGVRGAPEKRFYVKLEVYKNRNHFGYIINPQLDLEVFDDA